MSDCIFCKIVAGEIPCTKLYEDDDVLSFMDIGPIVKGHALVIPKAHHENLMETPDELVEKTAAVSKRIAQAQVAGLGADGIHLAQANGELAGQVVPHLHFHIIPRFNDDEHNWQNPQKEYASMDEMNEHAARIRNAII